MVLDKIFSVKNEYNDSKSHKVFYLFGFKFSFRNKKKERKIQAENEKKFVEQKLLEINDKLEQQNKKLEQISKNAENEKIYYLEQELLNEKNNSIFYIFPQNKLGDDFSQHNQSKKQILVLGYYGATNYGDELMLKNELDILHLNSNIEISVMFFNNYRYNFNQWKNIFAYYPPTDETKLDTIAGFYDELIIGGGAHLDDNSIKNPDFIPYIAIELSKKMIQANKTVKWVGVSSNAELNSEKYIQNLKYVVENCTEFSVRDTNSLNVLKNNNIPIDNVKLVNDLALNEKNKKIIAITLINFYDDTKHLVGFLNEIIRFIHDNNNEYKICLLPFFNDRFHDTIMFNELIRIVDFKNVEYFIAPEFNNVESMLMMIKGCDMFVNMRYHASLLSLKYNKPTISICYDIHPHYINKVTYINKYFNNENNVISYKNYKDNELYSKLMNLINKESHN